MTTTKTKGHERFWQPDDVGEVWRQRLRKVWTPHSAHIYRTYFYRLWKPFLLAVVFVNRNRNNITLFKIIFYILFSILFIYYSV
jgi:hypothetical protein